MDVPKKSPGWNRSNDTSLTVLGSKSGSLSTLEENDLGRAGGADECRGVVEEGDGLERFFLASCCK